MAPLVSRRTCASVAGVALLCLLALAPAAEARSHDLKIEFDSRPLFSIETFGFFQGGTIDFDLTSFQVAGAEDGVPIKAGFILHPTTSQSAEVELVQEAQENGSCLLDSSAEDLTFMMNPSGITDLHDVKTVTEEGLYDVIFQRCTPTQGTVSFELKLKMFNPGPNYLSAGEEPLPTVLLVMSLLFAASTVVWVWHLRKHKDKVQHLHRMMAVLVALKVVSLLFESITYHSVATRGVPIGWNVLYYIFTFLKGVLLFVVILLVGTGWSLLKPFLSEREKKIFLVVLPLQVLDNIALMVVGEMAPGSEAYSRWNDILHIVDIFCCCAILMPIVWSISHLRQASGADGKARDTLQRLTQFRQFYLMVVCYIYFTRIVVWIIRDTIPFQSSWVSTLLSELGTLVFYVVTGYKFRPDGDNPYVKVRSEDDDEDEAEFGLDDDTGVEMGATGSGSGDAKPSTAV